MHGQHATWEISGMAAHRRIVLTLAVVAILTGLAVQTGTLPGIDTLRRLQVAHSLWTTSPEVVPEDWPEFGVLDAAGRLHAWYGIGQSLLFVPGDVIGTLTANHLGLQPKAAERLRRGVVAISVYPVVTAVCVGAAYWLLLLLGFTTFAAAIGACGLLFGTSLLYWTHGGQENSLLLGMTLLGWAGVLHWARSGDRWGLVVSAAAIGSALLTRLPNAALAFIPAGAATVFHRAGSDRTRLQDVLKAWVPAFVGFALVERGYHYWRFRELFGTYFRNFGPYLAVHPELPAGWPWGGAFWEGFGGQLWSPERSAFLFDPLLILLAVFLLWQPRQAPSLARPAILTVFAMLVVAAAFHATLRFWPGGSSWGSRYVTVPAELGGCLAAALLAQSWRHVSVYLRRVGVLVSVLAVIVQLSSVLLDDSVEQVQTVQRLPERTLVVAKRLSNLWAYWRADDPSTLKWSHYPAGVPHVMLFPWMARMYSASRVGYQLALLAWAALVAMSVGGTLTVVRVASLTSQPAAGLPVSTQAKLDDEAEILRRRDR